MNLSKNKNDKSWYQSKTVWTGVVMIVTSLASWLTGDVDANTALQTGLTGLLGAFLRTGQLK